MRTVLEDLGPLGPAYEAVDWSRTPLGPVSGWSDTLISTVGLMIHSHFPITLLWGPEYVLIYNAAYVQLIGDKHPEALGRPAREIFPEVWDTIGPMLETARSGTATWVEDAYIPLHRRGFLEECYFTFSYSPVANRHKEVEGIIDITPETTSRVLGARRFALLNALTDRLADATTTTDIVRRGLAVLRETPQDVRAVDLWLEGRAEAHDPSLPGVIPAGLPADGTAVVEDHDGARVAWMSLSSQISGATDPGDAALAVRLSPALVPDEEYLGFLRLVAGTLSQALDRVSAAVADRNLAEIQRRMSEAFQRSLLPAPIRRDRPEVAVRYLPAVELGQIGGDWYDWFELPDGTLTVVVGDVAGHDQHAAAAMAQVRNMLRGVARILHPAAPSQVRRGLDLAMQGNAGNTFATAVLAQVSGQQSDALTFTWTNAGHPPPVLLRPDGTAELLDTPPNLLLGLDPDAPSVDHHLDLPDGATVVLYTDGLIERRGVPLAAGFDWLLGELRGRHRMSPEELCDHLLSDITDPGDDIALLVLRS
ncbi:MAG: SpoIIE family protein phosphatase [Nocardioides sp.]